MVNKSTLRLSITICSLLAACYWNCVLSSGSTDFYLIEMDASTTPPSPTGSTRLSSTVAAPLGSLFENSGRSGEQARDGSDPAVLNRLSASLCQAIPGLASWGLDCERMAVPGDPAATAAAAAASRDVDVDVASDFVIDWVADTGDDYMATLSVAVVMAQPELPLLQLNGADGPALPAVRRASRIVVGGDLMYPEPSVDGYEQRFKSAFRTALDVVDGAAAGQSVGLASLLPEQPPAAVDWFSFERVETAVLHFLYSMDSFKPPVQTHYPPVERQDPNPDNPLPAAVLRRLPKMLAAPGNHDHLDNLRAFQLAFFTENRVGGWRLGARQGLHGDAADDAEPTFTWHSFSVRQGDRSWVFLVLDTMYYEGASGDIGPAQFNDLTDLINRLSSYGSPLNLVMMMHSPFWTLHGRPGIFLQKLFRHLEELPHVALRLLLAGDMHYYARYNPVVDSAAIRRRAVETPLLVTCGLGGAFKHSTAQLQPRIVTTVGSSSAFHLVQQRCYPQPGYQWALFGLLWPSWNIMFFLLLLYVLLLLSPLFLTDLLFYRLPLYAATPPLPSSSLPLSPSPLLHSPVVAAAYGLYLAAVSIAHLAQAYLLAVELACVALAVAVPLLRLVDNELAHVERNGAALGCRLLFVFAVLLFLFPIALLPLFIASLCGIFSLPCCTARRPLPAASPVSLRDIGRCRRSATPPPPPGARGCLVTPELLRSLCVAVLVAVVAGLAVSAYEPWQSPSISELAAAYARKTTHNGFVRMQVTDEGRTLKVFFVSVEELIDASAVKTSASEPLGQGFFLRYFPLATAWLRKNVRLHDYFVLTELDPDEWESRHPDG